MEKFKLLFLIEQNDEWSRLIGHLENVISQQEMIETVDVIVTNTAVLSVLSDTEKKERHALLKSFQEKGFKFWLCGNTANAFHIKPEQLIPDIVIAPEGGIIKAAKLRSQGYQLFT